LSYWHAFWKTKNKARYDLSHTEPFRGRN